MSISFLLFRPHSGIVRHTCLHESFIVFIAVSTPLLALVALSGILRLVSPNIHLHYSLSVLLIAYLVTLFLMLTLRYSIKILYSYLTQDYVLGSNGSVIPIFEKQIASGGPEKNYMRSCSAPTKKTLNLKIQIDFFEPGYIPAIRQKLFNPGQFGLTPVKNIFHPLSFGHKMPSDFLFLS